MLRLSLVKSSQSQCLGCRGFGLVGWLKEFIFRFAGARAMQFGVSSCEGLSGSWLRLHAPERDEVTHEAFTRFVWAL